MAGQVVITPSGLGPILRRTGGPNGSFTISDVGDSNIRSSSIPRFDIYWFPTRRAANQFGVRTALTTISFPSGAGLDCPPGFNKEP